MNLKESNILQDFTDQDSNRLLKEFFTVHEANKIILTDGHMVMVYSDQSQRHSVTH